MSRNVSNYYYKTKGGHIPVKWTAPEAIFYNKYTIQSDVWSFGMVMYEIWSFGRKPFGEFTIEEVGIVMLAYSETSLKATCIDKDHLTVSIETMIIWSLEWSLHTYRFYYSPKYKYKHIQYMFIFKPYTV